MKTNIDPYEMLDVQRDVEEREIKAAYRRRSKILHPDAGGTQAEFEMLTNCRDLLLDPDRRKRYDETGEFEEKEPNNDLAGALSIISSFFTSQINRFVQSGFDPELDPQTTDLVADARAQIESSMGDAIRQKIAVKRNLTAVESVAQRFTRLDAAGENLLAASLRQEIEGLRQHLAQIDQGIRMLRIANKLLDDYRFDVAEAKEPVHHEGFFRMTTLDDMEDVLNFAFDRSRDSFRASDPFKR